MMARTLSLLALAVAVTSARGAEKADDRTDPDKNFDNLKPIAAGIGKAKEVVLYEGLPHQGFDGDALKKELETKKTVKLHGYPFYEEKLALKEADAKKLTEVFAGENAFQAFGGEKKCGGFHPDYLIEWRDGTDVYRVLVCFGCHEVKSYGPRQTLYCDIGRDAYQAFEKVLKPYRKNRPESKGP